MCTAIGLSSAVWLGMAGEICTSPSTSRCVLFRGFMPTLEGNLDEDAGSQFSCAFFWGLLVRSLSASRAARRLDPSPEYWCHSIVTNLSQSIVAPLNPPPELRGTDDRFCLCESTRRDPALGDLGLAIVNKSDSTWKQPRKILPSCIGLGDCMLAA